MASVFVEWDSMRGFEPQDARFAHMPIARPDRRWNRAGRLGGRATPENRDAAGLRTGKRAGRESPDQKIQVIEFAGDFGTKIFRMRICRLLRLLRP